MPSMRYAGRIAGLMFLFTGTVSATDFAGLTQRDAWLAHPVYGEASFDSFERLPGNPVVRGKAPFDWPVNGFLFEDPQSGNWFAYVGHYPRNYGTESASYCTVSRSKDRGLTWEHLGPVFPDTPHTFDGETSPVGQAPDVSVVFADGRYHMVYDWSTESSTWENMFSPGPDSNNGAAYAWADRPEGPFHRTSKPVCTTREQKTLLGKYRRQYASTIIRRASDWLVLTLTDSGPNFGWAYVGRTAASPEGPWSEATLLLHPEGDTYHPPLFEFHPSFVHDGFLYAPATSVAMNRNVQAVFRAPLEQAMDPAAWELYQLGSVWHAEPLEHEHDGIWGQTFTGFIGKDGMFNVLFPSRDPGGFGTINLARRPWDKPWNQQGFVVSAPRGPSLALLKRSGVPTRMGVGLSTHGTVRILWGAAMPLGPDGPHSDATLHPLMKTRYQGLEIVDGHWRLVEADDSGKLTSSGEGEIRGSQPIQVALTWSNPEHATLQLNGQSAWEGALRATSGAFGLLLERESHARVTSFEVDGALKPSTRFYLSTEALLSAAQAAKDWERFRDDSRFAYGVGAVSIAEGAEAKWNVEGSAVVLHAPRGPEFGRGAVLVDGKTVGEIDFHGDTASTSAAVIQIPDLAEGRHAIRLKALSGRIPVDVLEVTGG